MPKKAAAKQPITLQVSGLTITETSSGTLHVNAGGGRTVAILHNDEEGRELARMLKGSGFLLSLARKFVGHEAQVRKLRENPHWADLIHEFEQAIKACEKEV